MGNAPIDEYIKNDFLTEPTAVIFAFSWGLAYLISWFALLLQPNHISCDWASKIIVISVMSFLVVAMGLYIGRVPFLSRMVFAANLALSTVGLIIVFQLRGRLFKTLYGIDIEGESFSLPEHYGINYRNISLGDDVSECTGLIVNLDEDNFEGGASRLSQWRRSGVNVISHRDWFELVVGRVLLSEVSLQDLESVKPPRTYVRVKRILDSGAVFVLAPLFVPLALVIGLAIRLESKGPIFFTQRRVGLHGEEFILFKFRSMFHSVSGEGARFAGEHDARVTKVGRIIRRFRLDELPQVLNVIKGQMSLIGPRPEQPDIASRYLQSIPYYGFRHIVRPGISGWAQVSFRYAASDEETKRKLEYDFFYIKNMSFWLDLVVFLRTSVTILTGQGAR